ncbi:alpha/beta hydrolase [Sphingobium sp. V4]|uniref:alpha/beta hydrolase n=1 Tax=Sphingobium sp. V4 TaxID=3038927 RepID=UPI002557E589|nr:alpha/beta hydrolase [Sphingobium sp. V4]WIW89418.1 alpha/beta hydrolase [Sphingobium sp. V4]
MHPRDELDTLLTAIRAAPAMPAGTTLLDKRGLVEAMMDTYPIAADLAFEETTLGGRPCIRTWAPGSVRSRTVLLLHGGGYTMCSAKGYRALAGEIARASRATVMILDYRLAPEHPFPAAVDDALAAYRELLANGTDPAQLALCGDSAGGGLVAATLVAARDAGLALPVAAAMISPWVDLAMSGDSVIRNGPHEPILTNASLNEMAAAYLGERTSPRTPLASPLYADLGGLPPLMIQVGSRETLLDDALAFTARAAAADVRVRLEVRPMMFHGFHSRGAVLAEAVDTITSVGAFLDARFDKGPAWECDPHSKLGETV